VESLTTDLGRARKVAKEIGFFVEAEREIEEELRWPDRDSDLQNDAG
jgi:hypothetical protein